MANSRVQQLEKMEKKAFKFLRQNSRHYRGNLDMASIKIDLGKYGESIDYSKKAIELNPKEVDAYLFAANAYLKLNDYLSALEYLSRLIDIHPEEQLGLWLLCFTLYRLDLVDRAHPYIIRALKLNPRMKVLRLFLAYHKIKIEANYSEAIELIAEEFKLDPNSTQGYTMLSSCYAAQGKIDISLENIRKQIELAPDPEALDNLIMYLHYDYHTKPQEVLDAANFYYEKLLSAVEPIEHPAIDSKKQVLRIGFVSGDFKKHALFYFVKYLFEQLEEQGFEVVCFCNNREDDASEFLKEQVSAWHNVFNLTTEDAVTIVRKENIDILVDLSGHTDKNRLDLFARKPAPVQLTWLGQSGPMGLPQIDYMLANKYLVPEEEEWMYNEKVFHLPGVYAPYSEVDEEIPVKEAPLKKNGFVTFGSFNSFMKINPQVLELWSQILAEVPESRLLLKARILHDEKIHQEVLEYFTNKGIAAERLTIEGFTKTKAEFMHCYNRVDIVLDPFPLGGGTSSHDALWMSTPVIAINGDRFSHRYTTDILTRIGAEELIARDEVEYKKIAVDLASNLARIEAYKRDIQKSYRASAYCDKENFSKEFGDTLRAIWTDAAQ